MNIGVLTIATRKYAAFVPGLWWSMEKHFCLGHTVTLYVHSDQQIPIDMSRVMRKNFHIYFIGQDHLGWPFATLYRYRTFARNASIFSSLDYAYYMDIDSHIVAPVGDEIFGDLVAVLHPGFHNKKPDAFPHETRTKSGAYVPMEQRKAYYCGGVQGGSGKRYMAACVAVRDMIEKDLDNGVMPVWHDESMWNRYLVDNPPTKVLGSEYCVPEEFAPTWKPQPKLLALKKDHAGVRS